MSIEQLHEGVLATIRRELSLGWRDWAHFEIAVEDFFTRNQVMQETREAYRTRYAPKGCVMRAGVAEIVINTTEKL